MIKLRTSIILGLVACCLMASAAAAVPRVMLVEGFTNVGCPYCPVANAATHEFLADYGPSMAIGVSYHVWWPDSSDPLYTLANADSSVYFRRAYYGINSVPSLFADGTSTVTGSVAALEGAAATRLTTDSPLTVAVEQIIAGGMVTVTATVTAVEAVPLGDLALRIALTETELHYTVPPGSNGQTDFYDTMRDMLPDARGTKFTLGLGETRVFVQSTPVNVAWNPANIRAVVWVQSEATKEVLQAGSTAPRPSYAFFYGARKSIDVVNLGTLCSYESILTNYGSLSDAYDIHITPNLPTGWSGSVCIGTTCYPPWITDIVTSAAPTAQKTIQVDLQPLLTAGSGTMTLTATSRGDPTKTWTRVFKLISGGVPILCMDSDGGYNYETYYHAALDAAGHPYATWDRLLNGAPSAAQLNYFPIVIWNGGLAYPPVTATDRTALGSYLDSGGRLFISGQDIGWSLCDPASADYSVEAMAWYNGYLGADYLNDAINDMSLSGVTGDPIGDGLVFSLNGGTSADNQDYPSEIQPRSGAVGCVVYSPNREAAVRYVSGAFRVVYLAYGFEGMDTESNRSTLMSRSLDWLGNLLVAVPGETLPVLAVEPTVTPNPFNPATEIAFVVGGVAPVPVKVAIYDVRGRLVRELWDGPVAPGACALVWDGRTAGGARAASGVYLARVRVADEERALKLALTK